MNFSIRLLPIHLYYILQHNYEALCMADKLSCFDILPMSTLMHLQCFNSPNAFETASIVVQQGDNLPLVIFRQITWQWATFLSLSIFVPEEQQAASSRFSLSLLHTFVCQLPSRKFIYARSHTLGTRASKFR